MDHGAARTLDVNGTRIYLVDRGSGPATLFLHGNPDSADLWSGVIAQLSDRFRCLAPDLPGFGRSSAPAGFDCSLEAMARFIDDLIRTIGIDEPLNLVAHDFGGIFGLAWATTFPEKVRRIAVGGCPFFADYRWHFWAKIWRTRWLGELSMLTMNYWMFRFELKRGSRKLTSKQIAQTYSLVTPDMKRMVLRLYRATDPANFKAWEARLMSLTRRVPTLVLWGRHDPYVPARFAERFGARTIHCFPDCGHWYPAEEAGAVSALVAKFFAADGD